MHNPHPTHSSKCLTRNSYRQIGKAVSVEVANRERPAKRIVLPLSRLLHPGAVLMEHLIALCR